MERARDGGAGSSVFVRELSCGGHTVRIRQLYVGDVGCVVWDAALVLCKFLENKLFFPHGFWTGKRVIDLGSGTGVCGIVAATLGADVTVTDLPGFVELMNKNISANKAVITGSASAKTLVWGEEDLAGFHPPLDVVLLADVVYYEESLSALVKTVVDLSCEETAVLLCYEERTTGNKPQVEKSFFEMMAEHFSHSEVPTEKLDETFQSPDIHVIMFTKKRS